VATAVGATAPTQTVALTFTQGAVLGSIQVLTQGAANLDFTAAAGAASSNTCTVGATYTAGQACVVSVSFTPKAPGARLGAVVLYDNSATPMLLATSYIGGTGTSGQGLFTAGISANVAANLDTARGVSVDAAGNIYVSEQNNGNVDKFAAGTGVETVLTAAGDSPTGTVVDGAGNLYFGSANDGTIYELAGGTGNPVAIASGWNPDNVLLVDGAGNLYSPDENTGAIYEIAAGTRTVTTILPSGQIGRIVGMAIDANGNLYAADFNNNAMFSIEPGSSTATLLFSGNGLANPHGVAIDSAGNLYVTNYSGDGNVQRYAAGTYTQTELPTGSAYYGIAIDSNGNLLTLDGSDVTSYTHTGTSTVSFASTAVGTTTADSVTGFENDGNAALTIASVASTTGFPLNATDTTCAVGSLAAAGSCNLAASFSPATPVAQTGDINISDNTLNVAGTLQQVPLTGNGMAGIPVVTASRATISYGTVSATLSATLAFSGSITPTGALTFQVDGGAAVAAVCIGSTSPETCIATYPTATLTATTHSIAATLATDVNYDTASGTATLNITAIAPTIGFSVGSQTYGAAPFTVAATSNSAGAFTYTLVSGNATVTGAGLVTLTGIGPVTLQVAQIAAGNYTAAVQTATFTVNAAAPAISFNVAAQTYGAAPFTATSNSTGAFTYKVMSGNATVTSTGLVTLTGIGPVTLQVAQAAADNYVSGTQTATFSISAEKPTIAFNVASAIYSATPFTVSATSNSTGAFTYTVVSGNATVTSAGVVTLTGVGPVTLQATEALAGDYTASTAQASFTVSQAGTTTTLTASSATIHPNQTVTLTAQVTPSTSGTPSGSVTFYVNGTILMNVRTTAGVAQLTTLLPPGETAAITAVYSGDGNFTTSMGATSVVVGAFDFTLTGTGASAYTVAPGVAAVYGFALAPLYGSYAGPVSFTVTGLPAGAVASITLSTVAAQGGPTTVEMTVQTAPPIARNSGGPLGRGVMLALLLLPFGMKRSVRKKLKGPMLPTLLLLVGMTAAMTGCGSSNGFLLQTPQTCTLTVTATSGSLVRTQTVTLIVQ
jgi:sugar lactone lactonase YvrE